MIELLQSITLWHWVILALLLLAGEALGAAGFMIGISMAALVVAALMGLGLINDWQSQFLLFALLSVLASVIFWKFFRRKSEHDEASQINDRAAQLVGRKFIMTETLDTGLGKVQIADTFWKVKSEQDIPLGTRVEVYASEGMTLLIRPTE